MEMKTRLTGVVFFTLISLISFIYILININPYSATIWNFVLFYTSLGVATIGIFTLLGYFLRVLLVKNKIKYRLFKTAFKQAILIAIILIGFLCLWRLVK